MSRIDYTRLREAPAAPVPFLGTYTSVSGYRWPPPEVRARPRVGDTLKPLDFWPKNHALYGKKEEIDTELMEFMRKPKRPEHATGVAGGAPKKSWVVANEYARPREFRRTMQGVLKPDHAGPEITPGRVRPASASAVRSGDKPWAAAAKASKERKRAAAAAAAASAAFADGGSEAGDPASATGAEIAAGSAAQDARRADGAERDSKPRPNSTDAARDFGDEHDVAVSVADEKSALDGKARSGGAAHMVATSLGLKPIDESLKAKYRRKLRGGEEALADLDDGVVFKPAPRLTGHLVRGVPIEAIRAERWHELRELDRVCKAMHVRAEDAFAKLTPGFTEMRARRALSSPAYASHGIPITRQAFVRAFLNEIKGDPFALTPRLTRLFDSFDEADSGRVEVQQLECCFRVLQERDEPAIDKIMWFFDKWAFPAGVWHKHLGTRHTTMVRREMMLPMLQSVCVTDMERQQVEFHSHELYAVMGIPLPRYVQRKLFQQGVAGATTFVEEMQKLFVARMRPEDRTRVKARLTAASLRAGNRGTAGPGGGPSMLPNGAVPPPQRNPDGSPKRLVSSAVSSSGKPAHLWSDDAVERAGSVLIKFGFDSWSRMLGVFKHWSLWAKEEKHLRLAMLVAVKQYRDRWARVLVARWYKRAYYRAANRHALLRGKERTMKRYFGAWRDMWVENKPFRGMKAVIIMREECQMIARGEMFERELWLRRQSRYKRWAFDGIKAAVEWIRVKRAAGQFRRRSLLRRGFNSIRADAREHHDMRREKKLGRYKGKQEVEDRAKAEYAEGYAAFMAEVAKAKEEEDYLDRFVGEREKTLEHFDIKRTAKMLRETRRRKRAADIKKMLAEASAEADQREAVILKETREECERFLASNTKELKEYLKEATQTRWSNILTPDALKAHEIEEHRNYRWELEYDLLKVCRIYHDKETDERVFPPKETDCPKDARITRKKALQMVKDDMMYKRLKLARGKFAKERERIMRSAQETYAANVLQKKWKFILNARAMWKGLQEWLVEVREQTKAAEEQAEANRLNAAASKIKGMYRTVRARQNIRKLLSLLYQTRTDPATGGTYYVNTQTGKVMWDLPGFADKLVRKEDEDPDWVYHPAGKYYTSSRFEEKRTRPPPGYYMCVHCHVELAIRFCQKCGDYYCRGCFSDQHMKGNRALHPWVAHPVRKVKCALCKKRVVMRKCEECNKSYCAECSASVHDPTNMATKWHHIMEMWEG